MTPEEAEHLQRAYVRKRRRWSKSIGAPYADTPEPDPGELDAEDPENG